MPQESRFELRRYVGGPLLTTCYALVVPGAGTLIVDVPRKAWTTALEVAEQKEAPVQLVLATHGHWDHVTDMARLQEQGYRIAGHPADLPFFNDPAADHDDLPFIIDPVTLDQRLADGDRITIGDVDIQVLHTPGHTPGSVCLWIDQEEILITGDTLLKGGAGYLERPEVDPVALATSIWRLSEYPGASRIYPSHGSPTTIDAETWLEDAHDTDLMISYWKAGQRIWKPSKRE